MSTKASCKCLNVRIETQEQPRPESTDFSRSPASSSAGFQHVYVGEDGLTIQLPHLTLRSRSKGVPIPNTERCTRFISLLCIICQSTVYRVTQELRLVDEAEEGFVLPTEEWFETEPLRSASGYVEVYKQFIKEKAESLGGDTSYSHAFKLLVPSTSVPTSLPAPEQDPKGDTAKGDEESAPSSYLVHLGPVFQAPPFVPTHPVFTHLASVASAQSDALRNAADARIAEFVRLQTEDILKEEQNLRRETEVLYNTYRDGIEKARVEKEKTPKPAHLLPPPLPATGLLVVGSVPRFSVRDFVPAQQPQKRSPTTSSSLVSTPSRSTSATATTPRVSALSSSRVEPGFHHPKAMQHQALGNTNESSTKVPSVVAPHLFRKISVSSPRRSGSRSPPPEEFSVSRPLNRNMDDQVDMAASYRWFSIDEEMKESAEASATPKAKVTEAETKTENSGGKKAGASSNGKKSKTQQGGESSATAGDSTDDASVSVASGSSKGTRKVTFDVKPAVVTIKREVKAEIKEQAAEDARNHTPEMMFDLEEEGSDRSGTSPQQLLPLREVAQAPRRPTRTPKTPPGGLSTSFASLRPASLPSPSHVRPPARSSLYEPPLSPPPTMQKRPRSSLRHSSHDESGDVVDQRDEEIRKLVAANTPSHRGAWRKDGKAWQAFVGRSSGKDDISLIPEDEEVVDIPSRRRRVRTGEDDDSDTDSDDARWGVYNAMPMVGSLPITIGPLSRYMPQKTEENLIASYRPQSKLSSSVGPPGIATSISASFRDPGPLDFDVDDEDDLDMESNTGRDKALKILQARSKLPDPSMWRSLA